MPSIAAGITGGLAGITEVGVACTAGIVSGFAEVGCITAPGGWGTMEGYGVMVSGEITASVVAARTMVSDIVSVIMAASDASITSADTDITASVITAEAITVRVYVVVTTVRDSIIRIPA